MSGARKLSGWKLAQVAYRAKENVERAEKLARNAAVKRSRGDEVLHVGADLQVRVRAFRDQRSRALGTQVSLTDAVRMLVEEGLRHLR